MYCKNMLMKLVYLKKICQMNTQTHEYKFNDKLRMSKKLLISSLVFFCLLYAPAKAQWVTIPDANFVTKLTQFYPSCMNGNQMDTTCPQIVNQTYFASYYNNIADLTGIEYFDNLTVLICEHNLLTTLPPLPDSLKHLSCVFNHITNLPDLPPALERLDCAYNQLSILPTLPDNLWRLFCPQNQISSLPPLPNSLISLDVSNNQIINLPAIPISLDSLTCSNNQLTSVPYLPDTMVMFDVSNNNIYCLANVPIGYGSISNNPLTCVPNQTAYSLGLPLCLANDPINNPNNCIGVSITGHVYTDLNNNCSYDNTDLKAQNVPVKLFDSQNNLVAQSHTYNGVYSFNTFFTDTFKVFIDDANLPIAIVCGQTNEQSVAINAVNNTISNVNFPVVCDTSIDIYVQSVNAMGWVSPGQTHTLKTNIVSNQSWFNLNCNSSNSSGIVTIEVSGAVSFISAAPNALIPQVNGNIFTYSISDFNSLTPQSFNLLLQTDTTAQAGNQICVNVNITPAILDTDTTNNTYDFCYNVVNSYDPNLKEVYPVIVLPAFDGWFTYTIHFQNTGNAPAFSILLKDTLDAQLDLSTFEMIGYSHPAIITLAENVVTVRFNNIILPDSASDYEGSMGYFQFRIKPQLNLIEGSQISNTAFIYFDYNLPIITNTAISNFDFPFKINALSIEYVLYPNPSKGIFMFKDNKHIKTVEVFNIMGELVLSQGNDKLINLQAYPKGIYVARINGTQVCRLVKD